MNMIPLTELPKLKLIARDSIAGSAYNAVYATAILSVCPSHGWISQKRLKLRSCNFHCTVAPSLKFLTDKFHAEILTGSP